MSYCSTLPNWLGVALRIRDRHVFCVDDKSLRVNLLDKHDGKIKVFYFDEVLRDKLLEAQLSRTLVEVEIVINEKIQLGEDVEDGGKVVSLKKIEEDKLI